MRPGRCVVSAVAINMCLALSPAEPAAQVAPDGGPFTLTGSAVRTEDREIHLLVEWGLGRSPTLRRIVAQLNASDVIVHIRRVSLPEGFRGLLEHRVFETNGVRYLRITVDPRGAKRRVIPLIAHELQHALEVARVPEVGRSRDIEEFFRTIADPGCRNARCFETSAAGKVQEAVERELD